MNKNRLLLRVNEKQREPTFPLVLVFAQALHYAFMPLTMCQHHTCRGCSFTVIFASVLARFQFSAKHTFSGASNCLAARVELHSMLPLFPHFQRNCYGEA